MHSGSLGATKTTTFNLVNFGLQQLNHQHNNAQPMTGRTLANKKPIKVVNNNNNKQQQQQQLICGLSGVQMLEGLKPNITSFHSSNNKQPHSHNNNNSMSHS